MVNVHALPGVADSGVFAEDLTDVLVAVGEAALKGETGLLLAIDEVQYLAAEELAALITAIPCTTQLDLPVVLVGAGLPRLPGLAGNAQSFAERLFEFPVIGSLEQEDARCVPVHARTPSGCSAPAARRPGRTDGVRSSRCPVGASCAKVTTLVTTSKSGYNMAEIGIKDLKATASSVIDEVERGSAYVITKRGRPAAVLMPVDEAEDLVLANAGEYVRQRRQARADYAKGRSVRLEDLD